MKLLALRCNITTSRPESILSLLIRSGIPFSRPQHEENGLSFCSSVFLKKRLMNWANEIKCPIAFSYEGIITPIFALKHRPGIILGTILSLFLIYLSTFYVWSVRIEGNRNLSDGEIIQLLEECGFGEGSNKKDVDVNELQNIALTRCHELSFLSINIHGMVADVVVHERITHPQAIDPKEPYNLVADTDGVIVSSLVLDGKTMFENGDTVFKGQLLVSGLVESTSGSMSPCHAKGKVYARTHRSLTFTVPLEITEKRYVRTETVDGIRILGHSFHKKIKDEKGNYEVETEERAVLILGMLLPITRELRQVRYYSEENVLLSHEEAEERAYNEYRSYISTELDSAEITKEEFCVTENSECVTLAVEISAIENIAIEKKIEITE